MMNTANKGRCSRCDYQYQLEINGDGKLHNWCDRYDYWCKPVARNCQASPDGCRLKPLTVGDYHVFSDNGVRHLTVGRTVRFIEQEGFGAINKAESYLRKLKYDYGTLCGSEPVGFASNAWIAKWKNIDVEKRCLLDGIIVPIGGSFRDGGARILFFKKEGGK